MAENIEAGTIAKLQAGGREPAGMALQVGLPGAALARAAAALLHSGRRRPADRGDWRGAAQRQVQGVADGRQGRDCGRARVAGAGQAGGRAGGGSAGRGASDRH